MTNQTTCTCGHLELSSRIDALARQQTDATVCFNIAFMILGVWLVVSSAFRK